MDLGKDYEKIIVIGASAGGIGAVERILKGVGPDFPYPILIVEHNRGGKTSDLSRVFARTLSLPIKEAESSERISPGHSYIAPGDYHMLIEKSGEISLSVDDRVNWCRPSIDVLFESAADAFGSNVIAILLTGANKDGAEGVARLKEVGASILIQDPVEAEYSAMPLSAIQAAKVNKVFSLDEINHFILGLKENDCDV